MKDIQLSMIGKQTASGMLKSFTWLTFVAVIAITGCAPAVDVTPDALAPVAVEESVAEEVAVETPPAATTVDETDSVSDAQQPAVTTPPAEGRAGGRLEILDTPPADRSELLTAYAEAIQDQPFKYGDVGAVLEALAVEGMQRIYPAPAHTVVSGIEYSDATGRTLGELDIVVFLTASGDAVMVSEVKLSSNLNRAAQKADSQIRRFRNAITNQQVARIRHKSNKDQVYKAADFENVLRYGKVGSRGALEHGFDWEIDLARDEGDRLQQILLRKPALQP